MNRPGQPRAAGGLARLAVVAGVLAILLLAARGRDGRSGREGAVGSSQVSGPRGARGLYLLLERLGHRVERRSTPPGDLGPARLAFILSPQVAWRRVDTAGLRAWVERGGTLVYGAAEGTGPEPLGDMFGLHVRRSTPGDLAETSLVAEYAPAVRLAVDPGTGVDGADALRAISTDPAPAAVVMLPVGRGRVVALGGAGALENRALGRADNAVFVALLAARYAGGAPVVFDEWSHGYGGATGVLEIAPVPAGAAVALLVLALGLYAWATGRRMGPPSSAPASIRIAVRDQVDVLARFYARAGSRRVALARLGAVVPPHPPSDAQFVALARAAVSGEE